MAKKLGISVALVAALAVGGYWLTQQVLQPMPSDLSVIGKGTPALVLAYQNYSPTTSDALNRLNQVKDDYAERMVFVAADMGAPRGGSLARRFGLQEGMAVFMDGDGEALWVGTIPADEQALRDQLDAKLEQAKSGG